MYANIAFYCEIYFSKKYKLFFENIKFISEKWINLNDIRTPDINQYH